MRNEFSYSTFGFSDRDLLAALDAVAAAGFSQTEIVGQSPHMDPPPTGSALSALRQRLARCGLRVRTVHGPMRRNVPGAPDEEWRREILVNLVDHLRCASELAAEGMVVHPVPNPMFVSDPDASDLPNRMRSAFVRSLDELVPVAQATGVRLLFENLPYDCDYPLLSLAELREAIEPYPAEAAGLIIDTGHAIITGHDPADEIRAAGNRLWGTHLQDTDGTEDCHWMPGDGVTDWNAVRAALEEIGYAGPWTFEIGSSRGKATREEIARATRAMADRWNGPSR